MALQNLSTLQRNFKCIQNTGLDASVAYQSHRKLLESLKVSKATCGMKQPLLGALNIHFIYDHLISYINRQLLSVGLT